MRHKNIIFAERRSLFGRKVRRLRNEGLLPANIYGKDFKSVAVQVNYRDFERIFKNVGETQLLYVDLDKEEIPVLVHSVQKNPLTGELLHADFLKVNLGEKVSAMVPVVDIGESPAEKQGVGTVVFYINELEVEALPTDIPERIEVDISSLSEVDQSILVADLRLDRSKLEIKANPDELVAKVEAVKKEEENHEAKEEQDIGEGKKDETSSETAQGVTEENSGQ